MENHGDVICFNQLPNDFYAVGFLENVCSNSISNLLEIQVANITNK